MADNPEGGPVTVTRPTPLRPRPRLAQPVPVAPLPRAREPILDPGGKLTFLLIRPLSELFQWAWRLERRVFSWTGNCLSLANVAFRLVFVGESPPWTGPRVSW